MNHEFLGYSENVHARAPAAQANYPLLPSVISMLSMAVQKDG